MDNKPKQLLQVGDIFKADKTWYISSERHGVINLSDKPDYDEELQTYVPVEGTGELVGLEFVVVQAVEWGGGTGMGPHDVYPDGWEVSARKTLPGSRSADPTSPLYVFFQTGSFINRISGDIPV